MTVLAQDRPKYPLEWKTLHPIFPTGSDVTPDGPVSSMWLTEAVRIVESLSRGSCKHMATRAEIDPMLRAVCLWSTTASFEQMRQLYECCGVGRTRIKKPTGLKDSLSIPDVLRVAFAEQTHWTRADLIKRARCTLTALHRSLYQLRRTGFTVVYKSDGAHQPGCYYHTTKG